MNMRHPWKRWQRGSAMIELALSAGIIVAFFTGVFEFGYTFYAYNTLLNAVRAGARYASLQPYDPATAPGQNALQQVRNMVVYGDPDAAPGSRPVLAGLAPSNVAVRVSHVPFPAVTVSITGLRLAAGFSARTWDGRPSMTFPYARVP